MIKELSSLNIERSQNNNACLSELETWLLTSENNERIKIFIEIRNLGKDFLMYIYGGLSHIGCTIVCKPVNKKYCEANIINYTDHREELLCRPFAEALCQIKEKLVVCVCGMHIHSASKEEINEVLRIASMGKDIIKYII